MEGSTSLTSASLEAHLRDKVSAALLERWKEEIDRGERQAFLRYDSTGRPHIQMRLDVKDPSPLPQLTD